MDIQQGSDDAYNVSKWAGRNRLGVELFVLNFHQAELKLPAWPMREIRTFSSQGVLIEESTWGQEGNRNALLSIRTYECTSATNAQRLLVGLLGQFQNPTVVERAAGIGDVHFAPDSGGFSIFSRANMTVWVRSAGRQAVTITSETSLIDKHLALVDLKQSIVASKPPLLIRRGGSCVVMSADQAQANAAYCMQAKRGEFERTNGDVRYNARFAGVNVVSSYLRQEERLRVQSSQAIVVVDDPIAPLEGVEIRGRVRATPQGSLNNRGVAPERSFYLPILLSLLTLGGAATPDAVLGRAEEIMAGTLTSSDYRISSNPRALEWKQRAYRAKFRLKGRRLVEPTSPDGRWELTDAGRKYIRSAINR